MSLAPPRLTALSRRGSDSSSSLRQPTSTACSAAPTAPVSAGALVGLVFTVAPSHHIVTGGRPGTGRHHLPPAASAGGAWQQDQAAPSDATAAAVAVALFECAAAQNMRATAHTPQPQPRQPAHVSSPHETQQQPGGGRRGAPAAAARLRCHRAAAASSPCPPRLSTLSACCNPTPPWFPSP